MTAVARIEAMPDVVEPSDELQALTRNVQRTFSEIIEQIPYLPEELQLAVTNIEDPSALSHLIAGAPLPGWLGFADLDALAPARLLPRA